MEREIKMATKLYKCRDTAKSIAKIQGKDFKEMLSPYTYLLKRVMKDSNLEEIPALIKISKTNLYQESGMVQLLFMAATVEIIEPSV